MARRDDREYREYLREEQRSEPGCPARELCCEPCGRDTRPGAHSSHDDGGDRGSATHEAQKSRLESSGEPVRELRLCAIQLNYAMRSYQLLHFVSMSSHLRLPQTSEGAVFRQRQIPTQSGRHPLDRTGAQPRELAS